MSNKIDRNVYTYRIVASRFRKQGKFNEDRMDMNHIHRRPVGTVVQSRHFRMRGQSSWNGELSQPKRVKQDRFLIGNWPTKGKGKIL